MNFPVTNIFPSIIKPYKLNSNLPLSAVYPHLALMLNLQIIRIYLNLSTGIYSRNPPTGFVTIMCVVAWTMLSLELVSVLRDCALFILPAGRGSSYSYAR